MSKHILVRVPDSTKAQLDAKRAQGFSITGFIRMAIDRALMDAPQPKRPTPPARRKRTA